MTSITFSQLTWSDLIASWIGNHITLPTIDALTADSRCVTPRHAFLAYPGATSDGRDYIQAAIDQGAAAIFYEAGRTPVIKKPFQAMWAVPELSKQVGKLAACFYHNNRPQTHCKTVAVTGTNGKSSICHGLNQLYHSQLQAAGFIGTLGWGNIQNLQPNALTTPDVVSLHEKIATLRSHRAQCISFEASSHALQQNRLSHVPIDIALFTAITQDHLDYHQHMGNYAAAKAVLWQQHAPTHIILNGDCIWQRQWLSRLDPSTVTIYRRYLNTPGYASIFYTRLTAHASGFDASVQTPWGDVSLNIPWLGAFNADNILGLIAACAHLGWSLTKIQQAVAQLTAVPGRLQAIPTTQANAPSVYIDYAHTEDALKQTLIALHQHGHKHIHCVFGCGGDRDRSKRAKMGRVASQYATQITLTNDNPRFEDPTQIIDDIRSGIADADTVKIEYNRHSAILEAIRKAKPHHTVLIAGKGHEQTQQIGADKKPFDDYQYARHILATHTHETH